MDAEARAGECRAQLGDKLFLGVGRTAEDALLVASEPAGMSRPMAEFMKRGAVEVHRLVERLLRGQLHRVEHGCIKGMITADADVCATGRHQCLGLRDRRAWGEHNRCGHLLGQSLALVDVEDGEALEERHLPRLARLVGCTCLLAFRREAVGIANGNPALALAHAATQRLCLAEGEPALRGISATHGRCPEDEDVDPRIAPPGTGIVRHGAPASRAIPRLHPGQPPLFHLPDDLVGDLGIQVLPAGLACHVSLLLS